jgi:hypothetical protein
MLFAHFLCGPCAVTDSVLPQKRPAEKLDVLQFFHYDGIVNLEGEKLG